LNNGVPGFTQLASYKKGAAEFRRLDLVLRLRGSLRLPDGFKRYRQSFRYDGDRADFRWGSFGFLGSF
jgi:hypothetical protein